MAENQDIKGYITLQHIAASVISDRGIDDRFIEKILGKAIDGYAELNITGIIPSIKVAHLTVTPQNTVSLPNDYVRYSGIGIADNGRMWTFTRNRNILLPANMSCGVYDRNVIETNTNSQGQISTGYIDPIDRSGEGYPTGSYTAGGGFNLAYYRIDERRRMIVFLNQQSVSGLTIVLEYYSTGVNSNTIIPRDAKRALVCFIHAELDKRDRSITDGMRETSMREWRTERDKLYSRTHAFTPDEFTDEFYEDLSRGVKR